MFLFSQIIDGTTGTEAEMTIGFIKNVLSLLTLVSAVREKNFKGHLQAEHKMFKYCFVFNYLNCTLVFKQQVQLRKLQRFNTNAAVDITQRAFGDSLSGDLFSCLHSDLTTNIQRPNREATKSSLCRI